jgi:hypothetical protein
VLLEEEGDKDVLVGWLVSIDFALWRLGGDSNASCTTSSEDLLLAVIKESALLLAALFSRANGTGGTGTGSCG